jgi:2-dehydropantoate 2-reductase
MRILVIGAGGIGGVTAGSLAEAGHDVTIVDPWYKHVLAINAHGLRVTSGGVDTVSTIKAYCLDELEYSGEMFDVALLSVKSYDTSAVLRAVLPALKPNAPVVSLQNGMNEPIIANVVGPRRTIACVVHMGCIMEEAGWVRRTSDPSWPTFSVGHLKGYDNLEEIVRIAEALGATGPVRTPPEILDTLWMKLAVNCMNNAISVATGATTRGMWSDPATVDAIIDLGGEVVAVAEAEHVKLEPIAMAGGSMTVTPEDFAAAYHGDQAARSRAAAFWTHMAEVRTGGAENKPSALQDWDRGRRTEVDYLNGYIVRLGKEHGIAAPFNQSLVTMIRDMEVGKIAPDLGNSKVLADMARTQH